MHNAITIEALRVMDAIARTGSFAAAAESLFKVPSALTYTIRKLEDEIGVPLFDRSKQRAQLTPAGKLVLQQGRDILLATRRLTDAVHELESGWESEIRIARDTVVPSEPLYALIAEFNQQPQSVDIQLGVEALGGGWDALHSRRADIAIGVSGDLPKGLFQTHKMGELSFALMVSATHPLAACEAEIQPEQLQQYPSVVVADSSQLLPVRDSGLFNSKQVIRVDSMAAKAEAQALGLGVGFLPRHIGMPYIETGQLVEKACIIPRPDQPIYIAWRKEQHGKALSWFIEQLQYTQWAEFI